MQFARPQNPQNKTPPGATGPSFMSSISNSKPRPNVGQVAQKEGAAKELGEAHFGGAVVVRITIIETNTNQFQHIKKAANAAEGSRWRPGNQMQY